jgi:hypothetical protein
MSKIMPSYSGSAFICPENGRDLLASVYQVYGLPGIIDLKKEKGRSMISLLSAGKPYYEYTEPPESLMRARIIESWELNKDGTKTETGTLKIQMQHVFPSGSAPTILSASDKNEGFFFVGGMPDSWISTWTEVYFYPFDVIVGLMKRREFVSSGFQPPSLNDEEENGLLEMFMNFEGHYETDYRQSVCTDYDIQRLTKQLLSFVALEHQLAKQRVRNI